MIRNIKGIFTYGSDKIIQKQVVSRDGLKIVQLILMAMGVKNACYGYLS